MAATLSRTGLSSRSNRKVRRPSLRQRRKRELIPHCEPLEIKIAPATCTWTGAGLNARWSTSANWQSGTVPSNSNDVIVFPSGAAQDV